MNDSRLIASAAGTLALVVLLVVLLVLLRAERRRAGAAKTVEKASDVRAKPASEVPQKPDEPDLPEREVVSDTEVPPAREVVPESEVLAQGEVPAPADSDESRLAPRRAVGVSALLQFFVPAALKRRPRGAPSTPEPEPPTPSNELTREVDVVSEVALDEETRDPDIEGATEVDRLVDVEILEGAEKHDATASDHQLYRSRVDAAIRAISRRIGVAEDRNTVGARFGAAIDRLEVPVGFARPRLSPAEPTAPLSEFAGVAPTWKPPVLPLIDPPSIAVEPSLDVTPPSQNGLHPETRVTGEERPAVVLPDDEVGERTPEAPVAEETEVVVPVPPMATDDDNRRRGLWRRGRHG